MAAQRQTRRALLASVVAVPLLAARAARAEEGGEVKDTDIRALMLSTVLMGVAGFTAVGAASTPMGGAPLLWRNRLHTAHAFSHARACTDEGHEHH